MHRRRLNGRTTPHSTDTVIPMHLSPSIAAIGVLACAIGAPAIAQNAGVGRGALAPGAAPPSSGALLQRNPLLNPPRNPRAREDPAIEGPAPAAAPAADATSAPRLHVTQIVVDNAPAILAPQIAALVAPYRDRDMSLAQLRGVAVQITKLLLDHGESISYAYVPQQDIRDGVVRLRVLRGHIESIALQRNRSPVHDTVLQSYLERGLSASGDVRQAQSQVLRLADLPGVGAVTPVLSPAASAGGSRLAISVEAAPRWTGALVADNAGSAATGRNRLGAQLGINSPFGLGDRFQMVAYGAPRSIQSDHAGDGGNTLIGRISYDLPIGARGARAGLSASRVDYTTGGRYRSYGFTGFANVSGLYASYPLIRNEANTLSLGATLDDKRMTDAYAYFGQSNARSARVVGAELSGDRKSAFLGLPTAWQYAAGVSVGYLRNDRGWDPTGHTRGRFLKATQSARLSQSLGTDASIDLALHAQQTSRTLDSSEKMTLGGPNAVRAYGIDTLSADSGYVASATINAAVPTSPGLTAQVFYDLGQATLQKFARHERNRVRLAGYGVGLSYVFGTRATLRMSYALPRGQDALLGKDRTPMLWANLVVRF
ncbi:Heme/hemopexin transporter protein HuxB [Xanthomonas sacchari]|nr:Heme/hemopexin transporter protein HuxB [Xanthomonas sacchari]